MIYDNNHIKKVSQSLRNLPATLLVKKLDKINWLGMNILHAKYFTGWYRQRYANSRTVT